MRVGRVKALIKQNEDAVASTQAIAQQKGEDFQKAQQAYDEAAYKADQLQTASRCGQGHRGGVPEACRTDGRPPRPRRRKRCFNDAFLQRRQGIRPAVTLGMASKITDQSEGVYAKAVQDQNNAQSLTDTANVAKEALKVLAAQPPSRRWSRPRPRQTPPRRH